MIEEVFDEGHAVGLAQVEADDSLFLSLFTIQ